MVTNSDSRFPVGAAFAQKHTGPIRSLKSLLARDARSIKNARADMLQHREAVLELARNAGINWLKLYSNMSKGKLRVKLYGVYASLGAGSILRLNPTQVQTLTANGFEKVVSYSDRVDSYTLHID